jgi:hypothetical protein
MILFALAAGVMAFMHLMLACERPRAAIMVSGLLWLAYAVYEYQVAAGILCDSDCNIRVDLVLFLPLLGFATHCAYQAYHGQPRQMLMLGTVLGIVGLLGLWLVLGN